MGLGFEREPELYEYSMWVQVRWVQTRGTGSAKIYKNSTVSKGQALASARRRLIGTVRFAADCL